MLATKNNLMPEFPVLEVDCEACGGKGQTSAFRRCSVCDGKGCLPTELGKKVIELVGRHITEIISDR